MAREPSDNNLIILSIPIEVYPHVRAFAFFGGAPCRITYDNSRIAIRLITGCHARELTGGFLELGQPLSLRISLLHGPPSQ